MSKLHPPIRSYGGKGNFFHTIFSMFPKEYNSFIEPFCGSAVIALNHNKEKCSTIINDLNKNIYSFFKVLQNKKTFAEFKERLDILFYSEDIFKESLQWLKEAGQKEDYPIEDRAYHFFIVNRMSFSSNMSSFGKNMVIRRGVSKSVSDLFSAIDGMQEIHERLQQFIITNRNGIDLIEHYDRQDYMFYCDPPYSWDTRTSTRYPVDMDNEEQKRLLSVLVKSKSKFLVSGYDNSLYEEVLVKEFGWNKYSFDVKTVSGTNTPKTKQECLWYNYDL